MTFECPECGDEFSTERGASAHEWQIHGTGKNQPSKQELERLYFKDELTLVDIGEEYGVSKGTVADWMDDYGLERRVPKPPLEPQPWHDAETLRQLHHDKELTYAEMGDELGCSASTIGEWMKRNGIEGHNRIERAHEASRVNYAQFYTDHRGYEYWRTKYMSEKQMLPVYRLIAVAEHGFEAVAGNVIHHKNGIKWDNRPSNLRVMSDSDHKRLHNVKR
jgi:transcriptional regulator with XRE-family HTH domain